MTPLVLGTSACRLGAWLISLRRFCKADLERNGGCNS